MENTETPVLPEEELENKLREAIKGLYPDINDEKLARSISNARKGGFNKGIGVAGIKEATATFKKLGEMNKQNSEGTKTFTPTPDLSASLNPQPLKTDLNPTRG